MTRPVAGRPLRASALGITASLIGWFVLVEITSGILQGYYVPMFSDIVTHLGVTDADVNWFEAAQLLLSALVVPVLAKLGDMYGHKRILLIATVLTAGATWWIAFAGTFWSFLIAWALQGFYVVWLPLEIALVFERGRRQGHGVSATRRAAGLLVVGLQAGAIVGALAAGRIFAATAENLSLTLMIPAVAVTLIGVVIWFGVPESEPVRGRRLDAGGFVLLALALLLVTSALTFLRLNGPGSAWTWLLLAAGLALFVVFARFELRQSDPAVDIRVLRRPEMWPVQATAALVGISLLGAQGPLSTYAGTDSALGYGLGLDATGRSNVIGVYLVSLIVGAVLFAVTSRRARPRVVLIGASLLVGVGYLLFLPFHLELWQRPRRRRADRPASRRDSPTRRRRSAGRSPPPSSASSSRRAPARSPQRRRRRSAATSRSGRCARSAGSPPPPCCSWYRRSRSRTPTRMRPSPRRASPRSSDRSHRAAVRGPAQGGAASS
ncbi:MAG: norB [Microbacterium sp.]|nr:norB [Microbacterium sp.]